MKNSFKQIASTVYSIFYEAITSGIANLISAIFFLYFIGIGGLYVSLRDYLKQQDYLKTNVQRDAAEKELEMSFWVYLIMLLFNLSVFSLTIWLIAKFVN